jgi:hypothetical protein
MASQNARATSLTASVIALRFLIALNWLYGSALLALLSALFVAQNWTLAALGFPHSTDGSPINGLRTIVVLGLLAVPLQHVLLARLQSIVGTARRGDPFVSENAVRLRTAAWALLGIQVVQLAVALVATTVSTTGHPLDFPAFSIAGWLAVGLMFVLARVFAEGTRLRDDLAGTV